MTKFSELYPNAKPGDKIKEKSLLVSSEPKQCRVCGASTNFIEWCTEAPFCSDDCLNSYMEHLNETCKPADGEAV